MDTFLDFHDVERGGTKMTYGENGNNPERSNSVPSYMGCEVLDGELTQ